MPHFFNSLAIACLSSLILLADGETFNTLLSCSNVIRLHSFSGDCCALSDLANGGCQLEVVGGNCNITGPVWDTNIIASVRATCPTTAYNVLSGCQTDLDCPKRFCGSDGACHDYSCFDFFRLSPELEYDEATKTGLSCVDMEEDQHVLQYGCEKTIGGLVPSARGVGMKSNEVCSGISRDVAGGQTIAFECFQMKQGTNFTPFIENATYFQQKNATCPYPRYFYASDYEVSTRSVTTSGSSSSAVSNTFAGDGSSPSMQFRQDRALKAMYGIVTKTPGPSSPTSPTAPTPTSPTAPNPTSPTTPTAQSPSNAPVVQNPGGTSGAAQNAVATAATIVSVVVATAALF